MRITSLILSQFCLLASQVVAFQPIAIGGSNGLVQRTDVPFVARTCPTFAGSNFLHMASTSSSSSGSNSDTSTDNNTKEQSGLFSPEELQFLEDTFASLVDDADALKTTLTEQLPTMKPVTIMKLKQAMEDDTNKTVQAVAMALSAVLDAQMEQAHGILKSFLEAGEIRKMDALIGKAAKDGQLDAAFFSVLQMNLQYAAQEAATSGSTPTSGEDEDDDDDETNNTQASRVQILQHVYTRCQEEVEKNVPPGIALLNKLLRTEVDSIRANQLKHYLCPQPNVITAPDGTEIELDNGKPRILVEPSLLIEAIGKAVTQIRTVEQAGGTDRASAATMVESVRQVAKEARMVIGEEYGVESKELQDFEAGLQPVFRPESPESVYIKGE